MKTSQVIRVLASLLIVLCMGGMQAQDIGGIVKRKIKKRAKAQVEKTVDDGLDVIEGKEQPTDEEGTNNEVGTTDEVVTVNTNTGNTALKAFINPGTAIFVDDFDTEKPAEFPSRWTQLSGALETHQMLVNGEKDGVLKTISGNTIIKPTIEGDNYLGDEFKIEMQLYFNNRGNEAYYIELKNSTGPYLDHSMRISPNSMWSGSDAISRMPSSHPRQGWHTFQISFNKGHLKAYYDGTMLVNDPDITQSEKNPKHRFTHLELRVLSPSVNSATPLPQLVTYFAIGGKGHDLYKRLKSEGKLVMNNINFEVNSYTLSPSSHAVLDQLVDMMQQNADVKLNVHGHTDSDGSRASNQLLSENRAKSVMKYLTQKGIAAQRLSSAGFGEDQPIQAGNSAQAKALNRRVEFVLQ